MTLDFGTIISAKEIATSTTLIGRCVAQGITRANARQLVRRNSGRANLWRSEKLALEQNGRLFAHESFVGTKEFIDLLLPILKDQRPGLYRLARKTIDEGLVLKPQAQMLLASPIETRNTRYPTYEAEMAALEEVMLGDLEAQDTIGERFVGKKLSAIRSSAALSLTMQAALQTEISLTGILIDYFRRQNLISWNSIVSTKYHEGLISFNNYPFFAATFSWLSPMLRWKEGKAKPIPTPVVLHVSSGICREWDVEGFVARIERASYDKSRRLDILGIIAAPVFDSAAWKLAKENGFIIVDLRKMFGDVGFEALVKVQDLLKNVAGDATKANDEGYGDLAQSIEALKTNPFIDDLKSLAFETLTGFLVRNDGWEEVRLNLKVPFRLPEGATEREVDVSGQKSSWDKVCLIECKAEASNKPLDGSYVRKFFTETVPAFLSAKCAAQNPSHCKAELWTTGIVTDEAKNALSELKLKRFIQPKLLGRDEIIDGLPTTLKSTKRLIETIAQL